MRALKLSEVSRVVLPAAKSLHSKFGEVRLNVAPLYFIESDEDPLYAGVTKHKPDVLWLQLDPLLFLSRHRLLQHTAKHLRTSPAPPFRMENYLPSRVEECIVTLQKLDIVSKGKNFKHETSFTRFMHESLGPKENEEISQELMTAITQHVFNGACRWPYLASAVYPAVMSHVPVVLGDLPEVHLRCMLGNTLSLKETQEMFLHVVGALADHYSSSHSDDEDTSAQQSKTKETQEVTTKSDEDSFSIITTAEMTNMLYSHVFNARNKYVAASLRSTALKYKTVEAWIGADHHEPVADIWQNVPDLKEATQIPQRISDESDADLIEKQVILDLLLDTQVWKHPALAHPFPYLFQTADKETITAAKKQFHSFLVNYQNFMDENVKLPEELQKKLEEEMKEDS